MLIEGSWSREDLRRANEQGEFVRPVSPFRDFIGTERFAAEANRYHLFVNAGCPWAYRTILYRSLKGLASLVGISFTKAAAGGEGWTFCDDPEGGDSEPLLGARHIHDVYTQADATFSGRCTVPVLWDLHEHTIVNNESADIIRMFNVVFNGFEGVSVDDYYPDQHAAEIDRLNARIYEDVNNGVYRCGFAQSQTAYDSAFDRLFGTLDDLDSHLRGRRFLCGAVITEADWRLFATLVRFDTAYHGQFRCNRNRLVDFDYLWPYTRDLYQQPGVAETVDIEAIKGIYYGGRPPGILPKGPLLDFAAAHQRNLIGARD